MGRRRRQFSPPKIFAGAYARPETAMDFGLAFMMLRSQTVNVAYKERNLWILVEIFYFLPVFEKRFR